MICFIYINCKFWECYDFKCFLNTLW
jgi:hypothetical protein